MTLVKKSIYTKGMTCQSCEKIIAKQAFKLAGVKTIDVSYAAEKATIEYDNEKTSLKEITAAIEEKGYSCSEISAESGEKSALNSNWRFIIAGTLVALFFIFKLVDRINLPQISQNMGYGLLFVVGLLTGFHCVSMCGGFVVSYTAKGIKEGRKTHEMHVSYAVGKVISYTTIGAFFGLVGSIIAFTPFMRGVAGILAGLFLILFGLKMLNIFPALRKFGLPISIAKFAGMESTKTSSPFIIGLLNGLMIACGPLQAIYVMAAGTGSLVEGAKIAFIFALGTLPVMLGFGYLTSFIGNKATQKILKASAFIVIILGLIMLNRGLSLTGSGYDFNSLASKISLPAGANQINSGGNIILKDGYQEIRMDVLRSGWSPNKFVLKKGVPVKWIINGKELTGCNNAIQVPKLGLKFNLKPGIQTFEFTPNEEGTIPFSCWMGMIPGVFVVKDNVDSASAGAELNKVQVPKGGSCGAGGGGCGCGGAR